MPHTTTQVPPSELLITTGPASSQVIQDESGAKSGNCLAA